MESLGPTVRPAGWQDCEQRRALLIDCVLGFADVEQQRRVWVRREFRVDEYYDVNCAVNDLYEWFIDDFGVDAMRGCELRTVAEERCFTAFAAALEAALGERDGRESVSASNEASARLLMGMPSWPTVLETAGALYREMTGQDPPLEEPSEAIVG